MREERSVDGWIAHGRPVVVASGGRGRGVVGGGGADVDADVRLHTLSAICCLFLLSPVAFAFAACMHALMPGKPGMSPPSLPASRATSPPVRPSVLSTVSQPSSPRPRHPVAVAAVV